MSRSTAAVAEVSSEHRHDQNQFLTFVLGGEIFALSILAIKEILEYAAPTTVPMMPSFIRGVVNLRGAAVPVIDLAARFGRPATLITKKTCIVMVESAEDRQVLGIMVDAVNEVLEIPESEIEPAPAFGGSVRGDFIQGMGKVRGGFVVILDAGRVLSTEEMERLVVSRLEPAAAS
jgi:purine-binding chemotaxis protein CheW